MDIFTYNRIMILGNNGSGKSFLAKKLSNITQLPLIHLDSFFWLPNWQMPSKEEWMKKNIEFISNEEWIIDGMCNHGNTIDLRFQAADLIIFLDVNPYVCLASVIKRQGKKRSDTAEQQHLYEKFDKRFISFCKGIINFNKTRKLHIMDLHQKYFEKTFYVIKSRRKMNKLINLWNSDKPNEKNH